AGRFEKLRALGTLPCGHGPFGPQRFLLRDGAGTIASFDWQSQRSGAPEERIERYGLTSVRDRFGNEIRLQYQSARLVTIRDTLSFDEHGNQVAERPVTLHWTGDRLDSIEDFTGRSVRYAWDGARLLGAALPDGTAQGYAYGPAGSATERCIVEDPE